MINSNVCKGDRVHTIVNVIHLRCPRISWWWICKCSTDGEFRECVGNGHRRVAGGLSGCFGLDIYKLVTGDSFVSWYPQKGGIHPGRVEPAPPVELTTMDYSDGGTQGSAVLRKSFLHRAWPKTRGPDRSCRSRGCQRVGMPGLYIRLSGVVSTPLPIKLLSLASPSRHLDSTQKGGRVKSGRCGAHKPGKLGLGCKANKCSYAGTGDLEVLTTHNKTYIRLAVAHSKASCMAAAASVNGEVDIVAEAGVLDSIKCLLGGGSVIVPRMRAFLSA